MVHQPISKVQFFGTNSTQVKFSKHIIFEFSIKISKISLGHVICNLLSIYWIFSKLGETKITSQTLRFTRP